MKVILTYGTFDLFHVGHVRLLERVKSFGDILIVGVSTDEFNKEKGKQSFFSFEERVEILESCQYVDKVIPENGWEQKYYDINQFDVDVFVMGDDWAGEFDYLKEICEVRYIPRTVEISTTKIKKKLSKISKDKLTELEHNLKDITSILKALMEK